MKFLGAARVRLDPQHFDKSFVPKTFKDLPDSVLRTLYHDRELFYGRYRISLEPAAGAFHAGRFNHHELVASLIVDVFKQTMQHGS